MFKALRNIKEGVININQNHELFSRMVNKSHIQLYYIYIKHKNMKIKNVITNEVDWINTKLKRK